MLDSACPCMSGDPAYAYLCKEKAPRGYRPVCLRRRKRTQAKSSDKEVKILRVPAFAK